jgi:citrate synthase
MRAEASITIDGVRHEFPVLKGTLAPDVIDIGALYQDTGHFTYDPGFMSTASCESKITLIDGDKSVLLYRGYPIEQLAGQSNSSRPAICFSTASFPRESNTRRSASVW